MSGNELIFISYATPDRERVVPYYDALKERGYDVWMDFRRLKPGQNWDFEIKRALNRATLIIVLVSNNSVDRRGYVQREIKIALDKAMEKLAGDIYLIPVLLDDEATIPDELKQIHFVHASDPDCIEKIEDAIRHQIQQLGANVAEAQGRSSVRWSSSIYRDSWEGLPGYEAEFKLLHFSSEQYTKISEITEIIRGRLLSRVAEERTAKLYQDSERYTVAHPSTASIRARTRLAVSGILAQIGSMTARINGVSIAETGNFPIFGKAYIFKEERNFLR